MYDSLIVYHLGYLPFGGYPVCIECKFAGCNFQCSLDTLYCRVYNKGKSHGVRVCYTDFEEYEVIYLLTAFTKKEQDNLSDDEKKALKKLVKALKEEAARNWKGGLS